MPMTVLITGSNRGIGLELTRQYLAESHKVLACCREPRSAKALQSLQNDYPETLSIHRLDVNNIDDIEQLKTSLTSITLDRLINNAGVYGDKASELNALEPQALNQVLATNVTAPLLVTQALFPNVAAVQGKIVMISSRMGSISDNDSGGRYGYRASKAALNAASKSLALDLEAYSVPVVILHPGWVQTDMGGPNAWLTPAQAVKQMRQTIEKVGLKESTKFWHGDGSELLW
jgi:NAD(P)-dependent dehydrogenase (short-subunit alcohol dehydrogenase family)